MVWSSPAVLHAPVFEMMETVRSRSFGALAKQVLLLVFMLTTGCAVEQEAAGPAIHFTPHDNDAIEVLLRSEWVPMDVHPSCRSIGRQNDVDTIGAYVSALIVSQVEGRENWVEGSINPADGEQGQVWRARVTFHAGGYREDVIEFLVLREGGRVIPDSFRCRFFLLPWAT
jgi:hypothetical protein